MAANRLCIVAVNPLCTMAAHMLCIIGHKVTGSAALAARGVDIVPGDIDLVTDAAGVYVLESALRPHLVQPVVVTPHWVAVYFGRSFLDACVEWVGAVDDTADQPAPSDFGPVAAARLETIQWTGYAIRVPPLDLQIEANRRRGRVERVERIKNWTDSRQSP